MATGSAGGAMPTEVFLDTHFARPRGRVYAGFTGFFACKHSCPFTPELGNTMDRAWSMLVACTWKLLRPSRFPARDDHRFRAQHSPPIFTETRKRPNRLPKAI